ncbi:MAG TPA: VWA domain-containing protein [Candidatus Methylomirabilis sp.]|nr:VWA domain-containing protein [Candidatus Methylomirabilis sp.]
MKSLGKTLAASVLIFFAAPAMWMVARAFQNPAQATSAQDPPPPDEPRLSDARAKITVNTSLVVLPVTVKDGSGRLVPDLGKDEFRVFEDNVEQRIDVFTAEAFPLSMVVLIDNDLKKSDSKAVETSLDAIVGGMSDLDEAFICRFDEFFHPGKGFTSNQDTLLTELQRTKLDSKGSTLSLGGPFQGPTINGHAVDGSPTVPESTRTIFAAPTKALDDAVFDAAELLKNRPRNRRKLIFIVSDGLNGGKKYNTNTFDSTVKELLGHSISVFGVGVGSAVFDRRFERLSEYAHATGGDIYYAARSETMQDLYSRITEEARNQYTLAYVPRGTNRGKDFHDIEVRVRREGLTILTKNRYYTGLQVSAR